MGKILKKNWLIGLIVGINVLLQCGCGKNPIETVKAGTLEFDTTVTVGNAFEGYKYFKNKYWNTIETDQKRIVVEFRGDIDVDAYKNVKIKYLIVSAADMPKVKATLASFTYLAQFELNQDKKGFELKYNGFETVTKNGDKNSIGIHGFSTIQSIYKNQPDEAALQVLCDIWDALQAKAREAKKKEMAARRQKEEQEAEAKEQQALQEEAKRQQEEKVLEAKKQQALHAVQELWEKKFTKCGDSAYAVGEYGNIYAVKGKITTSLEYGDFVQQKEFSPTDQLNNVKPSTIEWQGKAIITIESFRHYLMSSKEWSQWGEKKFDALITKDTEGWKLVCNDEFAPTDCAKIPDE
jgi:hypothetical protein